MGKSSILNAMMNHRGLAYTSSRPGRTRLLNAFSVNGGKLVVIDMPGYGYASREEWGVQIIKYLTGRKQMRRAFVLIDAHHGVKPSDLLLLEHLGRVGVSYQILLSKTDKADPKRLPVTFENIRYLIETGIGGVGALGEVLAVAGDPARKGVEKIGISELRWSVLVACGLQGNVI